MPTVSIIIPAYNHAVYLPDAINSVLAQTYSDVEIIVVDDGSTDDTRRVAAGFGDAVHYVYQANRGLSAARNTGIVRASGDYIGLLDADDLYEPQFLRTLTSILDSEPSTAAAYCEFRFVDAAQRPLFQSGSTPVQSEQLFNTLLDGNFLAAHCLLVRRASYEDFGVFDESLSACEDWDMWLRLAKGTSVRGVDSILACYRLTNNSMSDDPARMLANRRAVLAKHIGPEAGNTAERDRRAYGRAYFVTALEYIQAHEEAAAVSCMRRAAELHPTLLTQVETFYELALWDQPKGARGDLQKMAPAMNASRLVAFLDAIFAMPDLPAAVRLYQTQAYALAHEALGRISYGRRELADARRHWLRSAAALPKQIANPRMTALFAKSLLGERILPRR